MGMDLGEFESGPIRKQFEPPTIPSNDALQGVGGQSPEKAIENFLIGFWCWRAFVTVSGEVGT